MDQFLTQQKNHTEIKSFDVKHTKVSTLAKKCIVSSSNVGECVVEKVSKKPLSESNLNESNELLGKKNVLENLTSVCKQKVQKGLSGTALKTITDSRIGSEENRVPAENIHKNLSRRNDNVNRAAISSNQQQTTTRTTATTTTAIPLTEKSKTGATSMMSCVVNSKYNYDCTNGIATTTTTTTMPSMKEIMKDIVVYVEVRSNEDNRSEGVKAVISELGARVNDKLLRDTTHVVFKDGLLSTYRKAKNWNIPIVSILWIEACKTQHKICNPLDFVISNVDRYENPEYYEKMKRIKAMQPDSELNKRVRPKAGTPKNNTPRAQKAVSTKENGALTTKNSTKTDIQKVKSTKAITDNHKIQQYFTPERKTQNAVDSPATAFLKKIDGMSASTNKSKESAKETSEHQEDTATVEMNISNLEKKSPTKKTVRKTNTRRLSLRAKPKNVVELQKNRIDTVEEEAPKTPANLSLSLKEVANETVLQAQPMEQSINDLCATLSTTRIPAGGALVKFDSARKPGHRRTMFDVSMDIISERLQNINRSSRRSIMPIDTIKPVESPTTFPTKILQDKKDDTTDTTNPATPVNTLVKKKRKLFVPNMSDSSLLFGTPPPLTSTELSKGLEPSNDTIESPLTKLTPRIEKKRRRTILHSTPTVVGVTKKDTIDKNQLNVSNKLAQRRRTLMPLTKSALADDAEKPEGIATKPRARRTLVSLTQPSPTVGQTKVEEGEAQVVENEKQHNNNIVDVIEKNTGDTAISCSAPPIMANGIDNIKRAVAGRRSTLDFVDDKQKQLDTNKPKKQIKKVTNTRKVLVFTNMHRPQADVIRQAVKTLGKFVLENVVTGQTTHLVSLEPRRTMNLLRGLARGLWILDYLWIVDSLAAGTWLDEEQYELKGFSNAIKICRAERQAFGNNYRCELFTEMGPFYISTSCGPMSKGLVTELVKLGGGNVVDSVEDSKYIITSYRRAFDNKIHITLKWVLDSLTNMQCEPHYKYAPPINHYMQPETTAK